MLDGTRAVCVEGIRDVTVKGKEGAEKVFVGVERRVARCEEGEEEEEIRERVWTADEEEQMDAEVIERRNIVFLRENGAGEARADAERTEGRERPVKRACICSYSLSIWMLFGTLTLT